jgi:hypothetical protein
MAAIAPGQRAGRPSLGAIGAAPSGGCVRRGRPVRIHLAEAGAGEPVLLLHGWPQHWFMWRHVVAG